MVVGTLSKDSNTDTVEKEEKKKEKVEKVDDKVMAVLTVPRTDCTNSTCCTY